MCGCLEIVLAYNIRHVGIVAVGFFHNLFLQGLRVVIERVAHLLDHGGLLKPCLHLLGVGLHL